MSETPLGDLVSFPPEPKSTVTCPGCGQDWTYLTGKLCPECQEREKRERAQREWREQEAFEARRDQALKRSGAPGRVTAVTFREPSRWPTARGAEVPVSEWEGVPELVTFQGDTNSGKTTLAAELLYRSGGGSWVVAADIADTKIKDWPAFVELLETPRVLVVDELGRGHKGDAWEYVYRLVGGRWDDLLPTIITTNLTAADLNAAHPALARRIREGWWVPLVGSWRDR